MQVCLEVTASLVFFFFLPIRQHLTMLVSALSPIICPEQMYFWPNCFLNIQCRMILLTNLQQPHDVIMSTCTRKVSSILLNPCHEGFELFLGPTEYLRCVLNKLATECEWKITCTQKVVQLVFCNIHFHTADLLAPKKQLQKYILFPKHSLHWLDKQIAPPHSHHWLSQCCSEPWVHYISKPKKHLSSLTTILN